MLATVERCWSMVLCILCEGARVLFTMNLVTLLIYLDPAQLNTNPTGNTFSVVLPNIILSRFLVNLRAVDHTRNHNIIDNLGEIVVSGGDGLNTQTYDSLEFSQDLRGEAPTAEKGEGVSNFDTPHTSGDQTVIQLTTRRSQTALTSALIYSVYGTIKHEPIGPLASSAALNSGIVSATFFSFREYFVTPLLLTCIKSGQFARRKQELELSQTQAKSGKKVVPPERLTWMQMRMEKLPDTAISGAFVGSLFNYWKRGRAGVVRGTIAATVVCSLLQLSYNELRIWRVRYVHQQSTLPLPVTPAEPPRPLWERTLGLFGMRKMSDEEYLAKMREKREQALQKIAELEAEEARQRTEEGTKAS
ncbi:hypothetical protein NM688_g7621 [Phlebia brevispora]|uniref:Uncharacterized protein n=1 Tax=Phlebia brevispora TaxID=194682 RepID=A0ACC1S309_9APHY|nr:hypothetical protein NM688_g7621 [Phlebia brevispora]